MNSKKIIPVVIVVIVLFTLFQKCSLHSVPKEKLVSKKVSIEHSFENDEYRLNIANILDCPNRIFISSKDDKIKDLLTDYSSIVLDARSDTTIIIKYHGDLEDIIELAFKWGNPNIKVRSTKIESLPFLKDDRYKLLQGNNSYPTHNHDLSRYSFDFTMKIGDTITSVQNGCVVSVIDGYTGWGSGNKWKSYANQVLIYDTLTHLFTMYGHLDTNGSLVEVGQCVQIGDPIAISGKTGQTTEEHLHFNVLRANNSTSGLISYPLDSIGKYRVKELKRYQVMEN